MLIADAQREMRTRFVGGFYGQLVSGALWLASAALATWGTPRQAITTLVVGGFFIFPLTELLLRLFERAVPLSAGNALKQLGMQAAFVLPLSMPLLLPIGQYRLTLFFPAMAILVGAHYAPFVFLYGMPMFAVLCGLLVAGGMGLGMYASASLAAAAWFAAAVLIAFAFVGRAIVGRER